METPNQKGTVPMDIRRLFAICALILVGGILVACGADDEDAEPTATTAPTTAPIEADAEPTAAMTDEVADASPAATPAMPDATPALADATPALAHATPVGEIEASPIASPGASPVASPDASPISSPVASPVTDDPADMAGEATPAALVDSEAAAPSQPLEEEAHEPEPTEVPMAAIAGTLTLDGREQQDYSISSDGCIGLGEWRQLKPGTQVIVRDATGTVVDIATLESRDSDDACSWSFAIDVPGADFFSVSIPMVTEVWFDQNDPSVQSGELELFVP